MKKTTVCALVLLGCGSDQIESSSPPGGSRGVTSPARRTSPTSEFGGRR